MKYIGRKMVLKIWAVFVMFIFANTIGYTMLYVSGANVSITVTITGADKDPFLGGYKDTIISGEKAIYTISITNNIDSDNNLTFRLIHDCGNDWYVAVDGNPVINGTFTADYTIPNSGSKSIVVNLEAPLNHTSEYSVRIDIIVVSRTSGDTVDEKIDITYKPKVLFVSPKTIDANVALGSNYTIPLEITNIGTEPLQVDCRLEGWGISEGTGSNTSWNIDISVFPVTVGAKGKKTVNLTLYPPLDPYYAHTTPNIVFNIGIYPVSDSDLEESVSVSAKVIESIDVVLWIDNEKKVIGANGAVEFEIIIENKGFGNDVAVITPLQMPVYWNIVFLLDGNEVQTIDIEPGNTTLIVHITAPEDPIGGDHLFEIQFEGKSFKKSITFQVSVPQTFGIELNTTTTANDYIIRSVGNNTIPIIVENKGNGIDSLEISFLRVPSGLTLDLASIKGDGITLINIDGESATFTISPGTHILYIGLNISMDVKSGVYNFTVYVVSKFDLSGKTHDSKVIEIRIIKAELEIIGDILISKKRLKEGEILSVKATVLNVYPATTRDITVKLLIDGNPVDEYIIDGLDYNRSRQVELKWKAHGIGQHLVSVVVSHEDLLSDVEEDFSVEVTKKESYGLIPFLNPLYIIAILGALTLLYNHIRTGRKSRK